MSLLELNFLKCSCLIYWYLLEKPWHSGCIALPLLLILSGKCFKKNIHKLHAHHKYNQIFYYAMKRTLWHKAKVSKDNVDFKVLRKYACAKGVLT